MPAPVNHLSLRDTYLTKNPNKVCLAQARHCAGYFIRKDYNSIDQFDIDIEWDGYKYLGVSIYGYGGKYYFDSSSFSSCDKAASDEVPPPTPAMNTSADTTKQSPTYYHSTDAP